MFDPIPDPRTEEHAPGIREQLPLGAPSAAPLPNELRSASQRPCSAMEDSVGMSCINCSSTSHCTSSSSETSTSHVRGRFAAGAGRGGSGRLVAAMRGNLGPMVARAGRACGASVWPLLSKAG
eukprot:scaffold290972_cov39-Tisochrysis_lutea.AAC.2